ncbi:MAG: YbjN domain-containing protein [Treponema sp.]|nr:YbjN domain-containing protein [Treponema sp.]
MKKALLCVLIACGCVFGLFAKDTTLQKGKVDIKSLQKLITSDYVTSSEIDDTGEIFLECDGIKGFIAINSKLNLVNFYSIWASSSDIKEKDAVALTNQWNSEKVFTCAYYSEGKFFLEYYMPYEGGISSTNFNSALEMFFDLADIYWDFLSDAKALKN